MRHRAKFREDRSNRSRDGRFSLYRDGGRRHLGFSKFQIFNDWDGQAGQTASACQFLSKTLKPRLRYGDF